MGHAEQPRTQFELGVVSGDRGVCLRERLPQRVLRTAVGEQAARIAQKRPPVALDERVESAIVARPRQLDEAVVGLQAQHRAASESRRLEQGPGCHLWSLQHARGDKVPVYAASAAGTARACDSLGPRVSLEREVSSPKAL